MRIVDHRGFSPLPPFITHIKLDASLSSDLKWEDFSDGSHILWELDFQIDNLSEVHLASYQLAVRTFAETVFEKHRENTLGVILYRGKLPLFEMDHFAEYLHHLAAHLPDETPPFALFDCLGDPMLFSKEIFPYIHLGFKSGPVGILRYDLTPEYHEATVGVALPLREKGLQFEEVDQCLQDLEEKGTSYRLIAEPYITEEWDELTELIIFPELISSWGMRMVEGFMAAGGKITSCLRKK